MKRNTVAGAALLPAAVAVAVACLAACASAAGRRHRAVIVAVPAVYVFGDSLVDVGNNDFLPPPAPRAGFPSGVDLPGGAAGGRAGRFTNGFNLADIVAQHVGFNMSPPAYLSLTPETSVDLLRGRIGANYASGGSGILDVTGNGTITLREQIQLFVDTKLSMIRACEVGDKRLNRLLSRSLFLINTGNNDFSAFGDGRATKSDAPAYIADMVSTYIKHIKALYKLGARRVGVLDALPIGCLPGTRASWGKDGACDDAANALARRFNALLRLEMAGAAAASMPGLGYSIASIYNIFSDMIALPGIEEVVSACCGGGRLNAEVECSVSSNLCTDRSRYMFWDKVHGTQAAYQLAGDVIFDGAAMKYTEPISFERLTQKQVASVSAVDLELRFADLTVEI